MILIIVLKMTNKNYFLLKTENPLCNSFNQNKINLKEKINKNKIKNKNYKSPLQKSSLKKLKMMKKDKENSPNNFNNLKK
jgi:hypothetical protein